MKENTDIKKNQLNKVLDEYKAQYRDEGFGKKSLERTLNNMKSSLEEKRKQVESLKNMKTSRIPAQFLASEKLAMNKRKYSPSKSQKNYIFKTKRSNSASK